jgi:hypothetical protein
MPVVQRSLATLAAVGCFALVGVGCGSDSPSDSATAPTSGLPTEATKPTAPTGAAQAGGGRSGANPGRTGGERAGGDGAQGGSATTGGGSAAPRITPEDIERFRARARATAKAASRAAGNRIRSYGSAVGGAKRAAVVDAMAGFMRALAAADYAKVCAGLDSQVREGLERFAAMVPNAKGKGCAALLRSSAISDRAADARRAANGTVIQVRIGGGQAYVIFRPGAGGPLSYVIMRREGSAWKAASPATGQVVYPPVPTLPSIGQ